MIYLEDEKVISGALLFSSTLNFEGLMVYDASMMIQEMYKVHMKHLRAVGLFSQVLNLKSLRWSSEMVQWSTIFLPYSPISTELMWRLTIDPKINETGWWYHKCMQTTIKYLSILCCTVSPVVPPPSQKGLSTIRSLDPCTTFNMSISQG